MNSFISITSSIVLLFAFSTCQNPNNNSSTTQNEKVDLGEIVTFSEDPLLYFQQTEAQLKNAQDVTKELQLAKDYINYINTYNLKNPQNENGDNLYFKGADVARGIKEYGKAIRMFGQVWRKYPNSKWAPDAIFLQGFTYENNLNNKKQAVVYYTQFIEKYPNHRLKDQVLSSLKNINTSDEELIKKFQKNIENPNPNQN